MEILIDIFGSDEDIATPVMASCNMYKKVKSKLILVGKRLEIEETINKNFKDSTDILDNIKILDCDDYIKNTEEPAWAIKNKKNSSIVVAYNYMKEHEDTVFISAGSTGAIMAGALLKIGRIKGIHRPALVTILPTINDNRVLLLDSGANPQAKDISIIQYAKLGNLYAKELLRIKDPKVALLNIGEESEKGTPELKLIYKSLEENISNFCGNIEARYILDGNIDVVVCDGLLGNIALKSLEGSVKSVKTILSRSFNKSVINKLVGLIAKPILTKALKKYDYKQNGRSSTSWR